MWPVLLVFGVFQPFLPLAFPILHQPHEWLTQRKLREFGTFTLYGVIIGSNPFGGKLARKVATFGHVLANSGHVWPLFLALATNRRLIPQSLLFSHSLGHKILFHLLPIFLSLIFLSFPSLPVVANARVISNRALTSGLQRATVCFSSSRRPARPRADLFLRYPNYHKTELLSIYTDFARAMGKENERNSKLDSQGVGVSGLASKENSENTDREMNVKGVGMRGCLKWDWGGRKMNGRSGERGATGCRCRVRRIG